MDTMIGGYSLPVLITVFLAIVYSTFNVPKKYKPLISVLLGICIGVLSMFINHVVRTPENVAQYIVVGLMSGAAASGLYSSQKSVRNIVSKK